MGINYSSLQKAQSDSTDPGAVHPVTQEHEQKDVSLNPSFGSTNPQAQTYIRPAPYNDQQTASLIATVAALTQSVNVLSATVAEQQGNLNNANDRLCEVQSTIREIELRAQVVNMNGKPAADSKTTKDRPCDPNSMVPTKQENPNSPSNISTSLKSTHQEPKMATTAAGIDTNDRKRKRGRGRGRPKKRVDSPEKRTRGRPQNVVDSPTALSKEAERNEIVENTKPAALRATPTPARIIDQCPENPEAAANLLEITHGQDSGVGTDGGDATVSDRSPSPYSPETGVVSIATTPSPQKPIHPDDPEIKSNDDFAEVCQKLQSFGWTINMHENIFSSPTDGYHHTTTNTPWRAKEFVLDKDGFLAFLGDTYGWTVNGTTTPKPKQMRKRGGRNAVTPTSSRHTIRRCGSISIGENEFKVNSEDEESFYHFPNLMKDLKSCGWTYLPGKLRPYNYVLPGCKRESKGGKYLKDFFYEESEVIQYCMIQKYYERRQELGLMDE